MLFVFVFSINYRFIIFFSQFMIWFKLYEFLLLSNLPVFSLIDIWSLLTITFCTTDNVFSISQISKTPPDPYKYIHDLLYPFKCWYLQQLCTRIKFTKSVFVSYSVFASAGACVRACVCVYVCMCVCLYIYIYIYI